MKAFYLLQASVNATIREPLQSLINISFQNNIRNILTKTLRSHVTNLRQVVQYDRENIN